MDNLASKASWGDRPRLAALETAIARLEAVAGVVEPPAHPVYRSSYDGPDPAQIRTSGMTSPAALQLGHRVSIDLDFFIEDRFDVVM